MYMKYFENQLSEGNLYNIQYFDVEAYTGNNRCFEGDFHRILSKDSIVTKVDAMYTIIPSDVFLFANLKNIQSLGEQNAALIGNNLCFNPFMVSNVFSSLKSNNLVTKLINASLFQYNRCCWDGCVCQACTKCDNEEYGREKLCGVQDY